MAAHAMDAPDAENLTQWLELARQGDARAMDMVLETLYEELRAAARGRLGARAPAHTLQPTALVHEVYLRLMGREVAWESRRQFLRTAARAMRQILVDHARRRRAQKRGGGGTREPFDEALRWFESQQLDFLALDEALTALADVNPRAAQLVELKYFGGLDHAKIAEILGLSERSVERTWAVARGWLYQRLA